MFHCHPRHFIQLVGGFKPWNGLLSISYMGCHPKPIDELTPSLFQMGTASTTHQILLLTIINHH